MKPTQRQADLIAAFAAKFTGEAKPLDYQATFTEDGTVWILSPRSKVFKTRKVLASLGVQAKA